MFFCIGDDIEVRFFLSGVVNDDACVAIVPEDSQCDSFLGLSA